MFVSAPVSADLPLLEASSSSSSTSSASSTSPGSAASAPATEARLRPAGFWNVALRFFRVQWTFASVAALWFGDRLGLRRAWYWLRGKSESYAKVTGPVAWRLAFERLGPTYVKLGQIIASGDGLFPVRYSDEFRACLDRVPPFSFAEVTRTLEDELGKPPGEVFASLDPAPLAAASIAQVHLATLPAGDEVVVKVQRPGIEPVLAADVALMRFYARVLSACIPHVHLANPVGVIEDLAATLAEEVDFRREAQHMRDFNATLARAGNTEVAAPRVIDALTTARVLTMERFRGMRVDDTAAILAARYDGAEKLLAGVRGWFQTLLLAGWFHGDVHAGNFMLLDDGRVGFLDFGIVGRFQPKERGLLLDYVIAFQTRDFDKLAEVLIRMGSPIGKVIDRARLSADLEKVFGPMIDPVAGFRMRDVVPGMMKTGIRHKLRMPREFVLVTKQLVYLDRYAKAIGGPTMNVLTDPRVLAFLMADLAAFGPPPAEA